MLFRGAQLLLMIIYTVLPVAMFAAALLHRRRGRAGAIGAAVVAWLSGAAIGVSLIYTNERLGGGGMEFGQMLRLVYLAIAALCLAKVVDRLLMAAFLRVGRPSRNGRGRGTGGRLRPAALLLMQRLVMLALIVPYTLTLLVVYRPRLLDAGNPKQFGIKYAEANFATSDGVDLAGWWIPAVDAPEEDFSDLSGAWGARTVILCHGVGASKTSELKLARYLVVRGFNVLVFDFRAHGRSGGNLCSYGDRERLDVLAAARWVRTRHPEKAEKLFGMGMNTGAAALLAAGAEDREGKLIDAVVLFEPFARLDSLWQETADRFLPRIVSRVVGPVSLRIAGLHAGADLAHFAPVECAQRLWPRPMLVVHGRGQTFISFGQAMDLYREAPHPKEQFWPADHSEEIHARIRRAHYEGALMTDMFREWMGTSDAVWDDAGVRHHVLQFLREAAPARIL